jgi:rubrerythrin
MVDENKQQKYLKEFETYFPESDRESGVIKEIREDLERIKGINDLEKKVDKASSALETHMNNSSSANNCYSKGRLSELNISEFDTIDEYKKLIKELSSYRHVFLIKRLRKSRKEQNQKPHHCSYCGNETEIDNSLLACQKEECQKKF